MKDKKHIDNFGIPKDYFEEFEDRLFNKISKGIIPKETGFSIPENYFNQMEKKAINTFNNQKKETKTITIISKKTIRYAVSIAAMVALFYLLFNSNQSNLTIDKIDISAIENYIKDSNLDIKSQDLTALLNEEDFSILAIENEIISKINLEAYLIENLEDTSILIEQ